MKKLIAISVFSAIVLGAASNASAFWGNNNDSECYGPYGKIPNCNPYDEWDPRYWMEEMEDMMDDDDDYRGGYGNGNGYQQPYGGGYQQPYGGYQQPYGYAPQQYAPAPYGYAPQQYAPQQPYYGNPYAAPAPVAPAAPAPQQ
ncbi:hypothetical protein [sulfur-oxidizing endosymbiont of Gigantopelta aegis]|uniref:hypothetical protein n=1 Tax=sulfur-oxidizing endosymbiont of Gigantopelta aegis TaxID=2794934 RepID=UPI0018DC6AC0|nr:hypothetical protein [sulfur-oxidizing endosymbiont of Gigantopelta aegis]